MKKNYISRLFFVTCVLTIAFFTTSTDPVSAQGKRIEDLAEELNDNGFYTEFLLSQNVEDAIEEANDAAIAFIWLDDPGNADEAAEAAADLIDELERKNSRYETVLVILENGYGSESFTASQSTIDNALNDSELSPDNLAPGIQRFTNSYAENTQGQSGNSSPSRFSKKFLFIPLILLLIGFIIFRIRKNATSKKNTAQDMQKDRQEIKQQLRDNADLVIDLGDKVIAHGDPKLIATYEEASKTYQAVSREIDDAKTAEEIDQLDDRIDQAEWQLDSIEATLTGKDVPLSPQEQATRNAQKQEAERSTPAMASDESIFSNRSENRSSSRSRSRNYQRSPRSARRRTSNMGGGGLAGMLGSILVGSGRSRSRRTQNRRSNGGFGTFGGGSSRNRKRRGSGRSFGSGNKRRGSGRNF